MVHRLAAGAPIRDLETMARRVTAGERNLRLAVTSRDEVGDLAAEFNEMTRANGTGLGLSVSYGFVKEHHGTIQVTSRVDEGTTFQVLLPLRQETGPPKQQLTNGDSSGT